MRKLEHLATPFIFVLLWPFICWLTHLEMTKNDAYVKKLKKASIREIKQKMLSVEWEFDRHCSDSLFGSNHDYNTWKYNNYYHASIVRFNGVGYILTPLGYLYSQYLQKKIRKGLEGFEDYKKPYVQ